MKIILTITLLISGLFCFGQNFPEVAFVPTTTNSNGDPLTNIVDPNGARQGQWLFKNVDNTSSFMQEYSNNELINSSLLFENNWLNINVFIQNSNTINQLRLAIISMLGNTIMDGERLITVSKIDSQIIVDLFGNWENTEQVKQQVSTLVSTYNLPSYSFIYAQ
ncbi:MAG: hypothetical protein V4638_10440 [Bacteroidota bacterium]